MLEKLIPELRERGYRVAIVKHHYHGDFEIDKPGKDSWRHAQAGADAVVIASPQKMALIRRVEREPTLFEIAELLPGIDVVLSEGFKRSEAPKIEVSRRARSTELICRPDELIAVAADYVINVDVPVFDLEDVAGLADLLQARYIEDRKASSLSGNA